MGVRCRGVVRGNHSRDLYGRLFRWYPVAFLSPLATCFARLRGVRGVVCDLLAGFEVALGTLLPNPARRRALASERERDRRQ